MNLITKLLISFSYKKTKQKNPFILKLIEDVFLKLKRNKKKNTRIKENQKIKE